MQTRNPLLDEFAKLTTGAMGLAQAAGEEAKAAWRAQADRFVAEMDLVRRDEFDVLKDEIAALRAEIAALKAAPSSPGPAPKKAVKGPSTDAASTPDSAG
ncbi:accessory factor UbiK family protein [Brevundimonas diminuta]|uniref:accessory factor UbiK family protein n=1 Tax=Brevundimonas diminuta TaxID=293 RepID=UPI003D054077